MKLSFKMNGTTRAIYWKYDTDEFIKAKQHNKQRAFVF